MRISSQSIHANAVAALLTQQAQLAVTQNQLATGKRVNTPADDPIAAAHILELERAQAASEQYASNSDLATSRLTLEEQAMADTTTLLTRVRELVVQASNTATLSDSDRQSVATELTSLGNELRAIANRQDTNGEYLFSGYSTLTQPFNLSGSDTLYAGDQGSRMIQISDSQRLADSHSGYDVFMNLSEGNGTFVTGPASANTGSGIIDAGTVTSAAQWVADTYTLSFGPTADTWTVTDSAGTQVATGTYTAGGTIAFGGVSVTVTGEPAIGDSFSIAPSGSQDVFAVVDELAAALSDPASDTATGAQLASRLGRGLEELDRAMDHVSTIRSEIGARLNTLDNVATARENADLEIASMLSDLRDLDYAEAIARMTQQATALEAAQASYAKVAQLSLFNYL